MKTSFTPIIFWYLCILQTWCREKHEYVTCSRVNKSVHKVHDFEYSELPNGWYSAFWELGPLPCGFFEKIFTTTCAFGGKNNPQMKKSDEIENQKNFVHFTLLCAHT